MCTRTRRRRTSSNACCGDIDLQAGGAGLPILFRGAATVRVTEVFPQMPLPAARPITQPLAPGLEKLTPELRQLVGDEASAATLFRLELIYALTPDEGTLRTLAQTKDLTLEGNLGPVVTVVAPLSAVKTLAALDEIAVVRLPRLPQPLPFASQAERKPLPLREAGVARLHAMGHRGKGVVVAIVDPDFRGWDAQMQEKKLPPGTRLLDLTRERSRRMEPDAWLVASAATWRRHCAMP